jgi:hypothetical protein
MMIQTVPIYTMFLLWESFSWEVMLSLIPIDIRNESND